MLSAPPETATARWGTLSKGPNAAMRVRNSLAVKGPVTDISGGAGAR